MHDSELLAAFAESRLEGDERRAMTAHLASCGDCRRVLAMLTRADGALPVPAKPRSSAPRVWLAVAAAVIVATVAVRRTEEPRPGRAEPTALREPAVPDAAGPVTPSTPTAASPVPEQGARSRIADDNPLLDPGLLVKRGGAVRQAGGKTFRLRAGEWVDTSFEPTASLPTVRIQGAEERAAAVKRMPGLGPYAALGERVVVVLDGSVYRFAP